MFDNLRDSGESPFYEEEQDELYKELNSNPTASSAPSRRSSGRLLGMTAQQRFIIALMLMFTVCILGTLAMFALGRMSLF